MIKYQMFVGLNDKDTKQQEITSVEAYKVLTNIVKQAFNAFTIYEGNGVFTHENGEMTIEKTLIINILLEKSNDKEINKIISQIKTTLNQESVMLEKSTQNVMFI